MFLNGIPIYLSKWMCKPEFVGWKRNHRKSRINKKWHKRYGTKTVCKGHGYEIRGMGIYGCPCFVAALEKIVKG